ncbi:hypothetical protein KP509_26G052600 [Ceratopteris richardii]|uniref:Uncharacterized protein n=1 Tax=Ceratopteris richardii TaxID=49495 RepID=A0A8T2RND1_CERRI|nr:hypothetical protein KP509_26G052600 [Ceratopteris richardii]
MEHGNRPNDLEVYVLNICKRSNSKSPCVHSMEHANTLYIKWWKRATDIDCQQPKFRSILHIPLSNIYYYMHFWQIPCKTSIGGICASIPCKTYWSRRTRAARRGHNSL